MEKRYKYYEYAPLKNEEYIVLAPQEAPKAYCPNCTSYNITWARQGTQKCLSCKSMWAVNKVREGVEL
jgi:hypothetical protein